MPTCEQRAPLAVMRMARYDVTALRVMAVEAPPARQIPQTTQPLHYPGDYCRGIAARDGPPADSAGTFVLKPPIFCRSCAIWGIANAKKAMAGIEAVSGTGVRSGDLPVCCMPPAASGLRPDRGDCPHVP
jgi:hypothetical protein